MKQDGATALFKAAHKGHLEVIQELLKYKPSMDILQVCVVNSPITPMPVHRFMLHLIVYIVDVKYLLQSIL
jgi:hypothetical protein